MTKDKTIEQRYQKKTQLEHILLRPDSYIGSVERETQTLWAWDEVERRMQHRSVSFVPGLCKIFDEILVNAADVKAREIEEKGGRVKSKMNGLKVDIDRETATISVWNDGDGIPVEMHKEHDVWVPELIFGHLLTSDNYDDSEERVTGGRNGFGAKLANIFSQRFSVECGDGRRERRFKMTWNSNMSQKTEPKITDFDGSDFVKVTFKPDLKRFGMDSLDDDTVALLTKRVYDVAGTCQVKVSLNGKTLPIRSFESYTDLYFPREQPSGVVRIHEKLRHWEVVISMSEGQFQHVSFVNSICTPKGGHHVTHVVEPLIQAILKKVNAKNKGGMEIKAHHVKSHLFVFVNCLIVNPTFESQSKEMMTKRAASFQTKCVLSEKTVAAVAKSPIVDNVLLWARMKQEVELRKKTRQGRAQTAAAAKRAPRKARVESSSEAGSSAGNSSSSEDDEMDESDSDAVLSD
eukprot:Polyplicarium_translucidae@DN3221_c0_g1_i2.p1